MMRLHLAAATLALALPFGAVAAFAQNTKPSATPAAPTKGMRAEFLADLNEVEPKIVGLAEAFPQEKYTWRPEEGVRSVSEVFLHVARANFGHPRSWGVQPPAGIELQGLEKSTTDKAKVIQLLKQSCDHLRQAVLATPDSEVDKPVKLFGRDTTIGGVLFLLATHQHEHLGQAIAYARMNGVVPPWTAARAAKEKESATPKK